MTPNAADAILVFMLFRSRTLTNRGIYHKTKSQVPTSSDLRILVTTRGAASLSQKPN